MNRYNLIVGGVPRSGKTTLCKRIALEYRVSHVSLDAFVKGFEKAFPNLGISNDATDYHQLCDAIQPFLSEYLHWLSRFKIPFVLDGYYFRPQDLKDLSVGPLRSVFLGYPEVAPRELLTRLREYETVDDWTHMFSDDVLIPQFSGFVRASSRLKTWCEEAQVSFVDVGMHREQQLEHAYRTLIDI